MTHSQLPPCSGRPGTVLAPSLRIFSATASSAEPACALFASGGSATSRSASLDAAISSPSRLFHVAKTSAEGAHPRMPGWMSPANLTCGIWRDEQEMPSKSQIAFALWSRAARRGHGVSLLEHLLYEGRPFPPPPKKKKGGGERGRRRNGGAYAEG